MTEINRRVFVTLNRENNMYYILNDQNFVCKYYADSDDKANLIFEAYTSPTAGFRERYAVENHEWSNYNDGCLVFTYGDGNEYQDANGAKYHIKRKEWVG